MKIMNISVSALFLTEILNLLLIILRIEYLI